MQSMFTCCARAVAHSSCSQTQPTVSSSLYSHHSLYSCAVHHFSATRNSLTRGVSLKHLRTLRAPDPRPPFRTRCTHPMLRATVQYTILAQLVWNNLCHSGCADCGRSMPGEKPRCRRKATHFCCAVVVRRASCGLQRQAGECEVQARRRSLSHGKGAQHSRLLRARSVALVVVDLRPGQGRCLSERPLSFRARPLCDVPVAASNAKPASRITRDAGAPARSLSLGWGHSTQACLAQAPCRTGRGQPMPCR